MDFNNKRATVEMTESEKEIFDEVNSLFKNAWDYHTYELPVDIGDMDPKYKEDYDNESLIADRKSECGFEKTIKEFEPFRYEVVVKDHNLVIRGEGIYGFAWGQPIEFPIYNKTLKDISTKWSKCLAEKQTAVKEYLSKYYKNVSIVTDVDVDDGDEGCVYPKYTIFIPVAEIAK